MIQALKRIAQRLDRDYADAAIDYVIDSVTRHGPDALVVMFSVEYMTRMEHRVAIFRDNGDSKSHDFIAATQTRQS